ncbi:HAMP domain-containing sensor histidine kinase [Cytobacillus firmus]|uniref:HAMP domain-containing sensor histidine kinase n=1 Tax=Cytobacillus firmus TaxID=1399 RepID=UPI0021AE0B38|nr:HAMP domain-containing sensor histidine kinase [Cytobacillus firmus]MBX9975930.1 HAMP domain-containing histidine kinase [Cytobacillus firmus]
MDIKLKEYSHSVMTKIIVFIIAIVCFTGAIRAVVEVEVVNDGQLSSVLEDNYLESRAFVLENENLIGDLTRLLGEYKNEENISSGKTISQDEWRSVEENLYSEFRNQSRSYNPELSEEKNFKRFKEEYADTLSQEKDQLIREDLREFHLLLQNIEDSELMFYASDGTNVFKNSAKTEKEQFENYPSYMLFEEYKREFYPKETEENEHLHVITEQMDELNSGNTVVYVAFPEELLDLKTEEWQENKAIAGKNVYQLFGFMAGFILSFFYLVLIAGRKSFKDQELHFHPADKLYNDINIVLFTILIVFWVALVDEVFENTAKMITSITIPFAALGLMLILSLVKHFKNRTLIRHTLIFTLIHKLVKFIGDVYQSGSVGVKTVLLVIGYPVLIALTFFMFPVTIGLAAWFAFKKIKTFNSIQSGVERIKEGNLHHRIEAGEKGEFSRLAANINSITDGLKKAVDNELKSERLKTELITNVSHDIRNPLTSIITYVDLLKFEKDPSKAEDYIEVLDQKSKRLKVLAEDLFEATKASSGNIPVHFEKIDVVSLITQGLGEVNDKIESLDLDIKLSYPREKVYITADGKLLWRSIENLLSNIFKYALKSSRVYISIEELGNEILITFKNISASELNISADELMERFKRGDESRSSQGSGLGLSIAKSLIEIQKGNFNIQIDGDLFKAIIYLPKHNPDNE